MESVYYRCETCGFTHQVPSYWSDFASDQEIEMEHINLATKEMCPDKIMEIIAE